MAQGRTIPYTADVTPNNPEDLQRYLTIEFERIMNKFAEIDIKINELEQRIVALETP